MCGIGQRQKRIVHITAHMGGGAGKAIAGLLCNANRERYSHSLVLLQEPKDLKYIEICQNSNIQTLVYNNKNVNQIIQTLEDADAIVINWWNHPAMSRFMSEILSQIQNRWIFWFHINGCVYPYIPYNLLAFAHEILFTTNYSLENQLWSRNEREYVKKNARVVFGMGDFVPDTILPKKSYASSSICIGYAGTVSYAKINRDYLNYIENIRKILPSAKFMLVGECEAAILNEIYQRGLQREVECVGKVDSVYPWYEKMDIFLYLLNEESYGTTENVLLEAMAVGLPIIVLDHPMERNIIKNGINGFVAQDEKEVLSLVKDLAEDQEKRAAIGLRAREYVSRQYDLQANVKEYTDALIHAMEKNKNFFPFQEVIGNTPLEWFLSFTGKERKIWEQLLEKESVSQKDLEEIKQLPGIYFSETKSSVHHFLACFKEDGRLGDLHNKLEKNGLFKK